MMNVIFFPIFVALAGTVAPCESEYASLYVANFILIDLVVHCSTI